MPRGSGRFADKENIQVLHRSEVKLNSEISKLMADHQDEGLLVSFEVGVLHLKNLAVPYDMQGSGIGTSILRKLTALADKYQLSLEVEPLSRRKDDPRMVTQKSLEKFYAKFGFKLIGRSYDGSGNKLMFRPASSLAHTPLLDF